MKPIGNLCFYLLLAVGAPSFVLASPGSVVSKKEPAEVSSVKLQPSLSSDAVAKARKHFYLMPYPIFTDQRGGEFLLLGTKKARSLVSHTKSLKDKSRIRNEISKVITSRSDKEGMFEDNSDDEVSASEKTSDSLFVRRKWIPKQIADEEKEKA